MLLLGNYLFKKKKMRNTEKTNYTVIRFGGIGTITFLLLLLLKVTHQVEISWWIVTAPLWLPIAIAAGFLLGVLLIVLIIAIIALFLDK